MYLHLGQDTVVTLDEIIGIFDLDTTTVSKSTSASHVRPSGRMIYISQISSTTLLKRTEFMDKLANI